MANFYPTTVYDWPSAVLAEALDGNIYALGHSPQNMTVKERETIAQRVTKQLGWENDRFLSALADTVLNPWVMLMAASPLLGETLPAAGRIFSGAAKSSAFVRKYPLVAQALKLLSPGQALRGTFLESAFMQADRTISRLENELAARMTGPLEDVAKRFNAPQSLMTKNHPVVQEINDLLHIKLGGLDQNRVASVLGSDGQFHQRAVKALVDQAAVDARIEQLGIGGLVNGMRDEFANMKKVLFGKDGVAGFEIDGAKVYKLHRNLRNEVFSGYSGGLMRGLVGEDLADAVVGGAMSRKEFLQQIAKRFEGGLDEQFYMPRNQWVTVNAAGREVPPEVRISQREGRIISTTNASAPRTRASATYHPDDLERLRKFATDPTELEKALVASREFPEREIARATAAGEKIPTQFRYDRINFAEAYNKHIQDGFRSRAFFLDAPDESVLASQRETLPYVEKTIREGQHKYKDPMDVPHFEDELGYRKSTLGVLDDEGPVGGWSVADAIWQGHQLMNDRVTQNTIADLFVPMALGQTGARSALMLAVQQNMQSGAGRVADVLETVLGTGEDFGGGIVNGLRKYATQDVVEAKNAGAVGKLAGYLYSTHLGFNLGSATINMLQPFITTARFVELPYVAQGYKETAKRMGVYFSERAKLGGVMPNAADKLKIMIKAFGEDVMEDAGIGPSALEAIDAIGFSGERLATRAGGMQKLQDLSMKFFEKSEWSNRLITTFSVRAKQAAQGLNPMSPAARSEAKTLVAETQFGGHWMNTPELFMDPKSPLSNSVLRQFLTFPVRMLTLTTSTAPLIRSQKGPGGAIYGAMNDAIRAMGLSAMVYESGKHVLGADIERGLYAGTVSQLVTQPPVPPVIGIPLGIATAMAKSDEDLLKRELPRMFPGGVAVARAMGALPQMGQPFGLLQRKYAGWDQPLPTGEVPVYKADGSLVEYADPVVLVARSLGLPVGGQATAQQIDKYLLGQREQMVQYRRNYLSKLAQNDLGGAQWVAKEFESRFGFKLSVSKQQVASFQRIRSIPRSQRILQQLSPDARPFYEAELQTAGAGVGLPPEVVQNAVQRSQAGNQRFRSAQPTEQALEAAPSTGFNGFNGFDSNPISWSEPVGPLGSST